MEVPDTDGPANRLGDAFVVRAGASSPAPEPPSPPLPSWAALVIGGLALLCVALAAALVAVAVEPDDEAAGPPVEAPVAAPPVEAPTFPAEPVPIPVELLTRLEAVGEAPLETEFSLLLDAIGHGFGQRSARLEPTLQSYVYRTAGRFEWSPDSFQVAVTAPDPALAAARGTLLEQLFADAVAAGRLEVGTGAGPHGLSLVSITTQ